MDKAQIGRGSILGAVIGDAAGATLEFIGRKPDRSEVLHALKMVGGGWWRTASGQITDDGEMALCLMHDLAGENSFSILHDSSHYLISESLCCLQSALRSETLPLSLFRRWLLRQPI